MRRLKMAFGEKALAGGLALLTPLAAAAQELVSQAAAPAATAASAPAAAASAPAATTPSQSAGKPVTYQIEAVTVTASKRKESAREVPAAVSTVTGGQLDKIAAQNFQDFATYLPGVSSVNTGGPNAVLVRGLANGGQASATVGVLVDDIPIGSSTPFAFGTYAMDFSTYDLERVELLSGPQGTLYGATTLGGLLKYVTVAPDLKRLEGQVQADLSKTQSGGFNHAERATLNLPFGDGKWALRANLSASKDAGVYDDPSRGKTNVDAGRNDAGRATLLGQLTPDLDLRLSAVSQKITREGFSGADYGFLTGKPVQGPYDQTRVMDEPSLQKLQLYSAVVNWKLGGSTLTSATGWQKLNLNVRYDDTPYFGPILHTGSTPLGVDANNEVTKTTQEIRLASESNKSFEWLAGFFYADEKASSYSKIFNASTPNGSLFGLNIFEGNLPTTYREYALFGDATVYLTDKFDVTLGMRSARDKQTYTQKFIGLFANPLAPSVLQVGSAESTENVWTYLINPRYRVNKDLMLFGRAASGYRPGGPNFTTLDASGHPVGSPTFKPDSVWNYELGMKSTMLDGRATMDLSVYRIDWKDMQTVVRRGGVTQLENANRARVQGLELSGRYRPTSDLTLGGSFSYTDAKLAEDSPNLGARSGQRLPFSPKLSAAVTADYAFPLNDSIEATAGLSVRYVGDRHAGFSNSLVVPDYVMPGYTLVDLRFGLAGSLLGDVSLYVKNVFNKQAQVSARTLFNTVSAAAPTVVTLAQPRTIGITLTKPF